MGILQSGAAVMPPALGEGTILFDELRGRAESTPSHEALLAPGRAPVTFAKLSHRISATAAMLRNAGLRRNDVVTVVMADGPDLLSIILGTASASICAPLNPALRKAEMEAALKDFGTRALIVDRMADCPAI